MAGIIDVLSIGIAAFVATNIDDLFILMVFFAKRDFSHTQVILGQYVGMGLLLTISLTGSLISLIIPPNLIGLVGLFPLAIGIKELVELRNARTVAAASDDAEINIKAVSRLSNGKWKTSTYLPFLVVIILTFSGGEEIGVYTSIFATYSSPEDVVAIIMVVMIMTGVWCTLAIYLVHHSFLATRFRRISKRALPLVLIGLGIYILLEAFLV